MMQCKCKEATLEILDPEAWKLLASWLGGWETGQTRPGRARPSQAGQAGWERAGQGVKGAVIANPGPIRKLGQGVKVAVIANPGPTRKLGQGVKGVVIANPGPTRKL